MKRILIGFVMLLLTVAIGSAQNFNLTFTAKTPFAVAGATLPAGNYQIRLVDADQNLLECAATSGTHSVLIEADLHEEVPTTTAVTFAKYGDKLILKNVSISGVAGYFIPISAPEKRAKKGGVKPTSVSIPAATK
jgi:hypothetical protein